MDSPEKAVTGRSAVKQWFAQRQWTSFAFQQEVWRAAAAGKSGLLHASTGAGKTYAVWFGALLRAAPKLGGPPPKRPGG
ncbi:hypothetical protein, partial [Herbaspirillum sp. YR522]|uniref:hypothetical protein n=1 Tax=Herbaspirillum sp. YR522 TaxID=1144342 RepID=UPI00026FA284